MGAFVPLHLNTAADHHFHDVMGGNLDGGGMKTYSITGFVLAELEHDGDWRPIKSDSDKLDSASWA
jgi:hypothetical protein